MDTHIIDVIVTVLGIVRGVDGPQVNFFKSNLELEMKIMYKVELFAMQVHNADSHLVANLCKRTENKPVFWGKYG